MVLIWSLYVVRSHANQWCKKNVLSIFPCMLKRRLRDKDVEDVVPSMSSKEEISAWRSADTQEPHTFIASYNKLVKEGRWCIIIMSQTLICRYELVHHYVLHQFFHSIWRTELKIQIWLIPEHFLNSNVSTIRFGFRTAERNGGAKRSCGASAGTRRLRRPPRRPRPACPSTGASTPCIVPYRSPLRPWATLIGKLSMVEFGSQAPF